MIKTDQSWYDQIDKWVREYQEGSFEAATNLIEAFQPYLNKYTRLLIEGKIDLKDKDSRNFIRLFQKNPDIARLLKKRWQSAEVRSAAYKTVSYLHNMCRYISEEDVRQELTYILLKLAMKYEKRNTSFAGYVYSTFKYELRRALQSLTDDPLTSGHFEHLPYFEDESLSDKYGLDEMPHTLMTPDAINEEIDHNWVHGFTSSEFFSKLSILDRLILKMYYIDEYNDREIANRTGFHINTINFRRRAVKSLIEREFSNEFKDD